jgi:SAM-dependent methyltransferase
MMFDGPRDPELFRRNGHEFLGHFIRLGGLEPDGAILDVGSGMGRKTVPLMAYLSDRGRYEGFDIVESGVEWCTRTITRRRPDFRFQRVDVHNALYNPAGSISAAEFRFPYPDATFDLVVAGSVFTHLVTRDAANYLAEVARVLKPGGRSLLTFFVLDDEAVRLQAGGRAFYDFRHRLDGFWTTNPRAPEDAIAFAEPDVTRMHAEAGLAVIQPIRYGGWSGRSPAVSFQDIVVATRT